MASAATTPSRPKASAGTEPPRPPATTPMISGTAMSRRPLIASPTATATCRCCRPRSAIVRRADETGEAVADERRVAVGQRRALRPARGGVDDDRRHADQLRGQRAADVDVLDARDGHHRPELGY